MYYIIQVEVGSAPVIDEPIEGPKDLTMEAVREKAEDDFFVAEVLNYNANRGPPVVGLRR